MSCAVIQLIAVFPWNSLYAFTHTDPNTCTTYCKELFCASVCHALENENLAYKYTASCGKTVLYVINHTLKYEFG